MATLVSPGVSVSIIDESFNVSSGPGTVPLVILATRQDKLDPSGTQIAEWTTKANAGKLYLATSQRDLLQSFGNPAFSQLAGTAQHADPLNEYGLLAAHSYLGLANRAFILRADVDLGELEPSDVPPVATPNDGTYWMDLSNTNIGLVKWNSSDGVFDEITLTYTTDETLVDSNGVPLPSAPGAVGTYTMVPGVVNGALSGREENQVFRRDAGGWVLLDTPNITESVIYRSHVQLPIEGEVVSMTLNDGGINYVVGDTVDLIDGGVGTGCQIRVDSVDGSGEILTFTILTRGSGYVSGVATQSGTSGVGVNINAQIEVLTDGDYWYKTTAANNGTVISIKRFNINSGSFQEEVTPLIRTRNDALLAYSGQPSAGDLFAQYDHNNEETNDNNAANSRAEFAVWRHNGSLTTRAVGTVIDATVADASEIIINGVTVVLTNTLNAGQPLPLQDTVTDTGVIGLINSAAIPNVSASVEDNVIVLTHALGQDITVLDGVATPNAELGLSSEIVVTNGFVFSNWEYLSYEASATEPTLPPVEGTLWYNNEFLVDIMVNNGTGSWIEFSGTVFLQPTQPDPILLTAGDLWIDTDQNDYPSINRWTGVSFVELDNSDQTSPNGVLFADARPTPTFGVDSGAFNGGGSNPDLDADRPDPLLYPGGMLLFNTRYSTRNVKKWIPNYTFEGNAVGDRWVTESGLKEDGSPWMGEEAQREVVVEAMQAAISGNDDIRAESIFFNLITAPGYPEMIDEMVTLNVDRLETAFIIGDSPMRLPADGTSLLNWATNANGAASNGSDGLLSANTYVGVYYPSGFSTNVDGEEVVVPASHIALRTMGYNDQVAYQWFAPAGYQRGVVTNAASVGYVNDEDEFIPVELSPGQRDVLYTNNINPISFRPNKGLVVFGQKTRHPVSSSLDRINVARLTNYIRYQAPLLSEAYLFEPNDDITRRSVKAAFDRFLENIVTLRGITDFLTVCDSSNNTPARIDRNELWVDLIIVPTRAVEAIYIPVRLRNTGSDLTLAGTTT